MNNKHLHDLSAILPKLDCFQCQFVFFPMVVPPSNPLLNVMFTPVLLAYVLNFYFDLFEAILVIFEPTQTFTLKFLRQNLSNLQKSNSLALNHFEV